MKTGHVERALNMRHIPLCRIMLWANVIDRCLMRSSHMLIIICDLSEQKQPFGCTLTNPLHFTPLRPDSTVIYGLLKSAILWYIALENPSINVEPGRNGVTCGGFVKVHPNGSICSERSHIYIIIYTYTHTCVIYLLQI